jgi:hypothetical protein
MSVEVAGQGFLFPPQPKQASNLEEDVRRRMNQKIISAPFVHMHLHDLESLWWVAVWIVFFNKFVVPPQSDAAPDLEIIGRYLEGARTLFPVSHDISRQNGFSVHFREIFSKLPEEPSDKEEICHYLDSLRQRLRTEYELVEATLPHSITPSASKDEIYDYFRDVFNSYKKSKSTLAFIPDILRELQEATESANDTGVSTQKNR